MNSTHPSMIRVVARPRLGTAAAALIAIGGLLTCLPPARAATPLADSPVFGTTTIPGNLLLLLSVEYPTAVDNAFTASYSSTTSNLGYFDPSKCYTYVTTGTGAPYFQPYSIQSGSSLTNHACTSTVKVVYTAQYSNSKKPTSFPTAPHVDTVNSTLLWSGNFLNWATMQTIDPFRWALTGGYRAVDTSTLTVLEKAWASGQGGTGDFPDRTVSGLNANSPTSLTVPTTYSSNKNQTDTVTTTFTITGAVPLPLSSMAMRIEGLGNKMNFAFGGSGGGAVSSSSPTTYDQSVYVGDYALPSSGVTLGTNAGVYSVQIRVKVCDPTVGIETNCTKYGSNYKPEGLIQSYSSGIRFGVFGYLNNKSSGPEIGRDAGVLRASMRYVGPIQPNPGAASSTNTLAEWDSSTGVFLTDPGATGSPAFSSDASTTNSTFNLTGSSKVSQSGVINYLNKFGEGSQSYKSYDPVSELYYAGIRYFKNEGNWAPWTSSVSSEQIDGFPVITNWTDPILYACQKNFILGLGDINTWADANLPGSTITSSYETSTKPTDTDASLNVKKATDEVGTLEGKSNLGTTWVDTGREDTYLMAGLAYDAHTRDQRAGDFDRSYSTASSGYATAASNKNSDGTKKVLQTISTYWLDVMEYQSYAYQNQFWLAAKYGGFSYPTGFCPKYYSTACTYPSPVGASGVFTNSTSTADSSDYGWSNGTDSTFPGVSTAHKKPANYYSAGTPDTMISGLQSAFASINSAAKATTSELNFLSANISSGTGSLYYAASYDASNWFGDLKALSITLDTNGNQVGSPTTVWSGQSKLDAQATGTGWQNRKIATSTGVTNATGQGIPFEYTNVNPLYTTQLSTVGSSSTSAQNLVNYLRGERSHEGTSTGSYHVRTHLLGDIVDSIPKVVGPPSASFSNSTNPGYTSFASSNSTRKVMVYVGANDGMMHAFDGASSGSTAGQELFAYVPSFLFSGPNGTPATDGLAGLANPSFVHHYYVNGQIGAFDIDFNKTYGQSGTTPDWHSVVVGGLGKGGKGYYAIDVTNPAGISTETTLASKVLWEFTNLTMGYSFGTPVMVKTKKYGWVAIFTSGYGTSDGVGRFYIVNPYTGAMLEAVSTGVGSVSTPAGLAHATAFVNDYTDGTADAVYAGDLLGNVWRLDLTGTNPVVPYSTPTLFAKLWTGCSSGGVSGAPQPITTNIQLAVDSANTRYVLVGTGKLLASTDIADGTQQSFYAIIDGNRGAFNSSATRYPIAGHCLTNDAHLAGVSTTEGWYYDLTGGTGSVSERVNVDPSTSSGLVFWAGNIPSGDPCSPTGSHYDYVVALSSGRTVQVSTTDTSSTIEKSAKINGLSSQSAFLSVDGNLQLYELTDQGDLNHVQTSSGGVPKLQQLNWREIPSTN